MTLNEVKAGLDAITITVTRPRSSIVAIGENADPTDDIFLGITEILAGKNFVVQGYSKRFVNNKDEYIQSNKTEIIVQLKSTHLMKNGFVKIDEVLNYLKAKEIKAGQRFKKGQKAERPKAYFQITRLDFHRDFESSFDLVKLLAREIGYTRFFSGLPKGAVYRPWHEIEGKNHFIKELNLGNAGFSLVVYNKKSEIIEEATPEKLSLYPELYREIISSPSRYLFRVELRFFRSRSVAFNSLSGEELFNLHNTELKKFGEKVGLTKLRVSKRVESSLFAKLLSGSSAMEVANV